MQTEPVKRRRSEAPDGSGHRAMLWALAAFLLCLAPLWRNLAVHAQERTPIPRAQVRSPHGALDMPCENCHTYTSWKPLRGLPEFHHDKTRFPLLGMHGKVSCTQCHTKLVFSKAGTKCADCHADLHRGQFGANCERCHTEKGWQVSQKEITQHFNRFPLTGAHAMQQCDSCHRNSASGIFQGLSSECYFCHQKDYLTPVLDHRALNLPPTCLDCHSMNSFAGAKFDHLKYTGFALTGMHAGLDCAACHPGGRYKGTPANCYGCHQKDFVGSTNPNHVAAGFPTTCTTCHNTVAWTQVTFDHATYGHWALTGLHATTPCVQCHTNNNYTLTQTACSSCHMANYNATTNPNHAQAGFPTDCSICHSTSGWSPAIFDHSKTTFPLTGAHTALQCAQCHKNGNYTTLPTTCYGCHATNYNGTTNPPHQSAGFPTDCTLCHTTTAWSPASFDHSKTAFPLTGAHVSVTCASCHVNNNYTTVPTLCYACHSAEYKSTTNPNHTTANFPTTCQDCHTTSTWLGATFNHDTFFPIYSGTHAGKWSSCADCHVNSANYSVFSCINCHQHSQANTDPHHSGVKNYVYNATSCYGCHRTGGG